MARPRSMTKELEADAGWQLEVSGALVMVGRDAQPSLAHPYAPASVGDAWVYAQSQAQSVDRIVAAERRGDRMVARVRSEGFGAVCERDLVITALGVTPELGVMTSAAGEVTVRAAEGVYLPRELPPGLRWDWRQELETPMSAMSVVATCAVVGHDWFHGQITVRVRCETHNRMSAPVRGGVAIPPVEHVQIEDNDYVRGIGLVRSVTTTPAGYRAEKLLVRWQIAGAPQMVDAP